MKADLDMLSISKKMLCVFLFVQIFELDYDSREKMWGKFWWPVSLLKKVS